MSNGTPGTVRRENFPFSASTFNYFARLKFSVLWMDDDRRDPAGFDLLSEPKNAPLPLPKDFASLWQMVSASAQKGVHEYIDVNLADVIGG